MTVIKERLTGVCDDDDGGERTFPVKHQEQVETSVLYLAISSANKAGQNNVNGEPVLLAA